MTSRNDYRCYSHYQSHNEESQDNSKIESGSILKYLSHPNGKSLKQNKENIQLFDEVNNLLKRYKQNPLKKKQSMPNNDSRLIKEVCSQIRSRQYKFNTFKNSSSTSPMTQKKNLGIWLNQQSKITRNNNIISPKGPQNCPEFFQYFKNSTFKSSDYYCFKHLSKKAKYFDKESSNFFCTECSIKYIQQGIILTPIDEYQVKHRNIFSDSELVRRKEVDITQPKNNTNFWSVDEDSLLQSKSNLDIPTKLKSFDSSFCELEEQIKLRELDEFTLELNKLKNDNEIKEFDPSSWQDKLCRLMLEMNSIIRIIQTQINTILLQFTSQVKHFKETQERVGKEISKEINIIFSDIQRNKDNIINQMQLKPFRYILQKYREKMKSYESQVSLCTKEGIKVQDKQNEITLITKNLEQTKEQLKQKFNISANEILAEEDDVPSTQRNFIKRTKEKKSLEHVYISFENKELFMTAQKLGDNHKEKVIETVQSENKMKNTDSDNFLRG